MNSAAPGPPPVGAQQPLTASTGARAAAAILSIAWCATLIWLVLATANPVTLNRRQILDADAVVTAQFDDQATGHCHIVRQWSGASLPEEIAVERLAETAVSPDGNWILPLVKTGSHWEVVPSALPSHARLVYPATPDAERQLGAILKR